MPLLNARNKFTVPTGHDANSMHAEQIRAFEVDDSYNIPDLQLRLGLGIERLNDNDKNNWKYGMHVSE